MRTIRRNYRLLLSLVAAWSVLLGSAHALHAVHHAALSTPAATAAGHSCTLCVIDRDPLLPTPATTDVVLVLEPELCALADVRYADTSVSARQREALSPCAGRAPPVCAAS